MGNLAITNHDTGSVVVSDGKFADELVSAPSPVDLKPGTILARKAVNDDVTVAADGGNTGDGTVTLAAVVQGFDMPIPGDYVLECIAAEADGGTFSLTDPNGDLVADDLVLTPGAGQATDFESGGLSFRITDGAADFVLGDKFTLSVTGNGNLVPFDPQGVGGANVPHAVLTYGIVTEEAATVAARVLVGGEVNVERLVVHGETDPIDTDTVDALRDVGIFATPVQQLGRLDNQ